MKIQNQIKYIIVYLILNLAGVFLVSRFWWTDSLELSFFKRESFIILMSAGLCWIGILYLSILIIRKFIINDTVVKFIGPLDFISNEMYQKEIGYKEAVKFKKYLSLVAFPILILTVVGFIVLMNIYQDGQLKKYGKSELVIVSEIRKDIKQNPYVNFKYNNGKNETNMRNENNLKIGDKFQIIFSTENPEIVTYLK